MILQLLKTLSLEANDTLFCVIFIAFEYGLACYIRSFLLRWWSWSLQKRFQLISLDKSIQPTNLQYFCKWTFTFSILPQAVCPVNDHKYLDIETGYKLMNHLSWSLKALFFLCWLACLVHKVLMSLGTHCWDI